ncbi:MAG: glycosyltransferase [Acidimicrobiia bacterium]|nr:glycosyltransferase [Acidimicrobiia bacterium]
MVSVVIVNFRGADDTIACLESCRHLNWPRDQLELIVVDNASGDDSVRRIEGAVPDVKVVASKSNLGFAGGCNRGAEAAAGDYIAFINNDARPHADWIRAAVGTLEADSSVSCIASKVLDWEGTVVDFVDAGLAYYGHAFKLHVGEPDDRGYDREREVLFASGAAMVVRADVFRSVGGFDERYFMFFEDVDFGWRLWLLGHQVRFLPTSLVYHRHHASMARFGSWREHYLLERNALFTIYKNYDDDNLAAVLPAAVLLAVKRSVVRGGDEARALDLAHSTPSGEGARLDVSRETVASTFAIDALVELLPELTEARRAVQAARTRTDREIMRLFRVPFQANCDEPFPAAMDVVTDAFGIRERLAGRRRIVVATGDALTPKMAGPGIRAWNMAVALSGEHDVELVTYQTCTITHPRFTIRRVSEAELRKLEEWCDVLIFQGYLLAHFPFLRESNKVIVVDIYDPFHLEQLEQARDLGQTERRRAVRGATEAINDQLARGDFFMCASTKQRDFWLGQLSSVGRINPTTYDTDESLESLVTVVPFGLPEIPPSHDRRVMKGVVPGIGADDKVVLWGGGVYNWFDPLTLLRAVDRLRHRRPDVRLFFLGLRHPNPDVPEMRMAVAARELAAELGLSDRHVFFNEDWVAYEDRQNYLLEADVGVSTHLDHVETAFSFRTRILDYFWAGLPVVATGGDALAELIETRILGLTVPPGDVEALEEALFRLLDDEEFATLCRKNIDGIAGEFTWSKVLDPLIKFCREPERAPDLAATAPEQLRQQLPAQLREPWLLRNGLLRVRRDAALAREYFQSGGLRMVLSKVRSRLRKLAPS